MLLSMETPPQLATCERGLESANAPLSACTNIASGRATRESPRRLETAAAQPKLPHQCQPATVRNIRLSPSVLLDMLSMHQPRLNPGIAQRIMRRQPIHARAFQHRRRHPYELNQSTSSLRPLGIVPNTRVNACDSPPSVHSHWPESFRCSDRLDPVSFNSRKSFARRH